MNTHWRKESDFILTIHLLPESILILVTFVTLALILNFFTMTKQLIIGLATLSVAGAALLGSGMYAATTPTSTPNTNTHRMEQRDPTTMLASIKTKVSAEAYIALETLMTKHKIEMDTLKSNTGTTQAQIKVKHDAFKAEMNALITKYGELKTVMPQSGQMGDKGGRGGEGPMKEILTGVSDADKTAIEAIHTEYQKKTEALRTEEKAKIDAIIAKYPELKAKLAEMEKNRPADGQGRGPGPRGGQRGMQNNNEAKSTTTSVQ